MIANISQIGGAVMKRRSGSFKTKEIVGIINAIRKGRVAEEKLEEFLCSKRVPPESKYAIQLDLARFKRNRFRILNGFAHAGLRTIGDLIQKTEREISSTKNLGGKSVQEILATLSRYGLSLGHMQFNFLRDEWIRVKN